MYGRYLLLFHKHTTEFFKLIWDQMQVQKEYWTHLNEILMTWINMVNNLSTNGISKSVMT